MGLITGIIRIEEEQGVSFADVQMTNKVKHNDLIHLPQEIVESSPINIRHCNFVRFVATLFIMLWAKIFGKHCSKDWGRVVKDGFVSRDPPLVIITDEEDDV